MMKLNLNLNALWKVAVVVLLAAIAFYGYRIDNDLRPSRSYTPIPIGGCGTGYYRTGGSGPAIMCPLQQTQTQ